MVLQMAAGFGVRADHIVILEAPSCAARTAGAMRKMADTVRFTGPETPDIAAVALLVPGAGVEMSVRSQRRYEGVTMLVAAGRKIGATRKMQRDEVKSRLRLGPERRRRSEWTNSRVAESPIVVACASLIAALPNLLQQIVQVSSVALDLDQSVRGGDADARPDFRPSLL